jgi:hypothetical protein
MKELSGIRGLARLREGLGRIRGDGPMTNREAPARTSRKAPARVLRPKTWRNVRWPQVHDVLL